MCVALLVHDTFVLVFGYNALLSGTQKPTPTSNIPLDLYDAFTIDIDTGRRGGWPRGCVTPLATCKSHKKNRGQEAHHFFCDGGAGSWPCGFVANSCLTTLPQQLPVVRVHKLRHEKLISSLECFVTCQNLLSSRPDLAG